MVLKRIGDMISASLHEGLDQIENPRVMLNQYLREMEHEIAKAKQAIVKQQMLERNFETKMKDSKEAATKRKKQAELAFDAGEEDLARAALSEMKHYEAKAGHYEGLYEKATGQVAELRAQLSKLEERYDTLKDKKYALIARANAAKAKEHIQASLYRVDSDGAFREFQRLEDRIVEMEMKADMWTAGRSGATRERKLVHLEYAEEAEKELEKLRERKSERSEDAERTP
ncbi:MAG TPA: PspA/IM30 family protein [Bacillales bacterium]|nr:PspA/IM30 family protein [Bacillales bacterium]